MSMCHGVMVFDRGRNGAVARMIVICVTRFLGKGTTTVDDVAVLRHVRVMRMGSLPHKHRNVTVTDRGVRMVLC